MGILGFLRAAIYSYFISGDLFATVGITPQLWSTRDQSNFHRGPLGGAAASAATAARMLLLRDM